LSDNQRLAVYRHVRERLDRGERVTLTNSANGYSTQAIGARLRLDAKAVKFALGSLVAQRWLNTDGPKGYVLTATAPTLEAVEATTPPRVVGVAAGAARYSPHLDLPAALLERMGVQTEDEKPEPLIMLDWAMNWAKQSIHVFPCRRYLGSPLTPRWYAEATTSKAQIVEWWSTSPEADIAGVPDRSGHFVIVASGDEGADSLAEIEAEHGPLPTDFRYLNRTEDSEHLWLKGSAITSHNRLGRGLHVLGAGHFVYLPVSWAPDHHWKEETHG
jgi:hypothetical protein